METDDFFMEMAVALGERGRLLSPPNPWVGSLVVREGEIVGSGYTQPPGCSHAEVMALEQAGSRACGATLYATLEPCSHWGRTPPCVEAIMAAGVARVVVAMVDPDSKVAGAGIAALRQANIPTDVGIGASAAQRSLEPYLYQRTSGMPFCVLKMAASIDGRSAAQDGTSQWITSEEARLDGHKWRAYSQAIAVGSGTASLDHPHLTVRHPTLCPRSPPLLHLFRWARFSRSYRPSL